MRYCAFSCPPARISLSNGVSSVPFPCAGSDFCFDCGCGCGCGCDFDGGVVARGFGFGLCFYFCFACEEGPRDVFRPGPCEHQPV